MNNKANRNNHKREEVYMGYYDIKTLTALVDNSPIFTVDRILEPERYEELFNQLYGYSFLLACETYCVGGRYFEKDKKKSEDYGNFAEPLRITLRNCLRNYDPKIAPFSHLLNAAFSKVVKRLERNNYSDNIRRDRDDDAEIRNFLRIYGLSCDDVELRVSHIIAIAREIGISPERVERYILKKLSETVLPEYIELDGEDRISRIDSVAEVDVVPLFMQTERIREIISIAQRLLDESRDSQTEIISMCFTADVIKGVDTDLHNIDGFDIIDREVVFAIYDSEDRILLQNEIASVLGKQDSAVCRTYSQFKNKLWKALELERAA